MDDFTTPQQDEYQRKPKDDSQKKPKTSRIRNSPDSPALLDSTVLPGSMGNSYHTPNRSRGFSDAFHQGFQDFLLRLNTYSHVTGENSSTAKDTARDDVKESVGDDSDTSQDEDGTINLNQIEYGSRSKRRPVMKKNAVPAVGRRKRSTKDSFLLNAYRKIEPTSENDLEQSREIGRYSKIPFDEFNRKRLRPCPGPESFKTENQNVTHIDPHDVRDLISQEENKGAEKQKLGDNDHAASSSSGVVTRLQDGTLPGAVEYKGEVRGPDIDSAFTGVLGQSSKEMDKEDAKRGSYGVTDFVVFDADKMELYKLKSIIGDSENLSSEEESDGEWDEGFAEESSESEEELEEGSAEESSESEEEFGEKSLESEEELEEESVEESLESEEESDQVSGKVLKKESELRKAVEIIKQNPSYKLLVADKLSLKGSAVYKNVFSLNPKGADGLGGKGDSLIDGNRIQRIGDWLQELSIEDLDVVWNKSESHNLIDALLRNPGNKHEWMKISMVPRFKRMNGIDMRWITKYRDSTKDYGGWEHGKLNSGILHHLLEMAYNYADSPEKLFRNLDYLEYITDTKHAKGLDKLIEKIRDLRPEESWGFGEGVRVKNPNMKPDYIKAANEYIQKKKEERIEKNKPIGGFLEDFENRRKQYKENRRVWH